jgi:hypothetical protein
MPEEPTLIRQGRWPDGVYIAVFGTDRYQCEAVSRVKGLAHDRAKYFFYTCLIVMSWDLEDKRPFRYRSAPANMSTLEIRLEAEGYREALRGKGIDIGEPI